MEMGADVLTNLYQGRSQQHPLVSLYRVAGVLVRCKSIFQRRVWGRFADSNPNGGARANSPTKTCAGSIAANPMKTTRKTSTVASAKAACLSPTYLATCHLCAIATRLGRKIHWDPKAEKIIGDDQATSFFARTPRPGFEIPRL